MKANLKLVTAVLVLLSIVSCSGLYGKKDMPENVKYTNISAEKAYNMIMEMPEIIIVDVSPIYNKGHIKGAVSAYVGDGTLDMKLEVWDKDATYLVYCHSDEASMLGAQKFIDAGFEKVYRLEGNYKAWLKAGYPIEK